MVKFCLVALAAWFGVSAFACVPVLVPWDGVSVVVQSCPGPSGPIVASPVLTPHPVDPSQPFQPTRPDLPPIYHPPAAGPAPFTPSAPNNPSAPAASNPPPFSFSRFPAPDYSMQNRIAEQQRAQAEQMRLAREAQQRAYADASRARAAAAEQERDARISAQMKDFQNQANAAAYSAFRVHESERKFIGETSAKIESALKNGITQSEAQLKAATDRSIQSMKTMGSFPITPAAGRLKPWNHLDHSASGNYRFQYTGPEAAALQSLHESLYNAIPRRESGDIAKGIGLQATELADQAYAQRQPEEAGGYQKIGLAMLDITLGLIPPVGFAKDTFEAITGRNLLTGEKLSGWERAFAVAGAVTLGLAGEAARAFKIVRALAPVGPEVEAALKAAEVETELGRVIGRYNPLVEGPLSKIPQPSQYLGVKTVADTFRSASYDAVKLVKPRDVFRAVSQEERLAGSYWTGIENPIGEQAKLDLALGYFREEGKILRNEATITAKVRLPAGMTIYVGAAAPITDETLGVVLPGGGSQIYIPKEFLSSLEPEVVR